MFEIIALVAVALAVWGLVSAAFRVGLRRTPPRWVAPLVVGLAMASFAVWNDYSWASRTAEALPPRAVVVETLSRSSPWQPWTYVVPRDDALAVLDRDRIRRNENALGYVMAEVALIRRYEETLVALHLFDCTGRRQTVVGPDTAVDAQGLPRDAEWESLSPDAPLLRAACGNS